MNLPFIGIVDILKRYVFFVLKQSVEFGMMTVETQFGQKERRVCFDQWAVTPTAVANGTSAGLYPARLRMCLLERLSSAQLQHTRSILTTGCPS